LKKTPACRTHHCKLLQSSSLKTISALSLFKHAREGPHSRRKQRRHPLPSSPSSARGVLQRVNFSRCSAAIVGIAPGSDGPQYPQCSQTFQSQPTGGHHAPIPGHRKRTSRAHSQSTFSATHCSRPSPTGGRHAPSTKTPRWQSRTYPDPEESNRKSTCSSLSSSLRRVAITKQAVDGGAPAGLNAP